MSAEEFDNHAAALADSLDDHDLDGRIAAACRGSGNPAGLAWLAEGLRLQPGHRVVDPEPGLGGPGAWLALPGHRRRAGPWIRGGGHEPLRRGSAAVDRNRDPMPITPERQRARMTPTAKDASGDEPDGQDGSEDVEEEFRSLMEGLRTTLPGVQLVTAFLLTVPLYDKFESLSHAQRSSYFLAFLSAVVASLLLTAPSSHQRLRSDSGVARRHRRHLMVAVKLAVCGSISFAIALAAASYLVASLVLGSALAAVVAGGVALVFGWSWYYLPLVTFRRDH